MKSKTKIIISCGIVLFLTTAGMCKLFAAEFDPSACPDSAAKVARYRCCVIQFDRMDSAGLLFRSSAVRKLYDGYAEKI